MTQTWPGANSIRLPSGSVNVVPELRFGRDQCTVNARPLRRMTAVPEPVEIAYGGRPPYSSNREVAILVYWMITVLPPSWPPSAASPGAPSIHTSHRPARADQRKVNVVAGVRAVLCWVPRPPGGRRP